MLDELEARRPSDPGCGEDEPKGQRATEAAQMVAVPKVTELVGHHEGELRLSRDRVGQAAGDQDPATGNRVRVDLRLPQHSGSKGVRVIRPVVGEPVDQLLQLAIAAAGDSDGRLAPALEDRHLGGGGHQRYEQLDHEGEGEEDQEGADGHCCHEQQQLLQRVLLWDVDVVARQPWSPAHGRSGLLDSRSEGEHLDAGDSLTVPAAGGQS